MKTGPTGPRRPPLRDRPRQIAAYMRAAPTNAKAWGRQARSNGLFAMGLIIAVGVIVIDQIAKHVILHVVRLPALGTIEISAIFDLSYVENRGVSFGLLAGGIVSRVGLSVVAIAVSLWVIRWLGPLRRRIAAIGAGLIVGGAMGNLYDRIAYGYVVDFLDFSGLYFPFVFNVADASICVGVACLAYDAYVVMPKAAASQVTKSEAEPGFRGEAAPGTSSADETVTRGGA